MVIYESSRHIGLSYTICRFTLWPTSSRMLLIPYLIMVGLKMGENKRETIKQLWDFVCNDAIVYVRVNVPFQGQTPGDDWHPLRQTHGQQHFRPEDPRITHLHPLLQTWERLREMIYDAKLVQLALHLKSAQKSFFSSLYIHVLTKRSYLRVQRTLMPPLSLNYEWETSNSP